MEVYIPSPHPEQHKTYLPLSCWFSKNLHVLIKIPVLQTTGLKIVHTPSSTVKIFTATSIVKNSLRKTLISDIQRHNTNVNNASERKVNTNVDYTCTTTILNKFISNYSNRRSIYNFTRWTIHCLADCAIVCLQTVEEAYGALRKLSAFFSSALLACLSCR